MTLPGGNIVAGKCKPFSGVQVGDAWEAIFVKCVPLHRRLYPDDRCIVMELQKLVRSGKMPSINSTTALATKKTFPTPRKSTSVNAGAVHSPQLCLPHIILQATCNMLQGHVQCALQRVS